MTACFRNTPLPNSQLNTRMKSRCVRTKLYRYVLTPDWITDFAARKHTGTPGYYVDTSLSVVLYILRETCFRRAYAVKWKDSVTLCIAIAHKKSIEGLKLATPERIEMVKWVLEVDQEPSWFNAA